jgi:hypothetical protein
VREGNPLTSEEASYKIGTAAKSRSVTSKFSKPDVLRKK